MSEPPQEYGLYFLVFPDARAAAQIETLTRCVRRECGLKAKPLLTSRFHVSLINIGQYFDRNAADAAAHKAADAVANLRASPFTVMFDLVQSFSGQDGHRPLVLRGDDGVVGLEMLYRSLAAAMRMAGFRSPWHFTPHLTLLYGERSIRERLIQPISWTVREFVLVLSLVRKTKYIRLGCWQLCA